MSNSDEIAYWNGDAGATWVRFQEQIDRAFEPLTAAGLAAANARSAQAVLDVGCGCGTTLLELACAVGRAGSVVGADVSQPMLEVAERRALARGLGNVSCLLADASTRAFGENAFDLVFSRFGVMFFDDPVGAFGNLGRSLRPGGRLVFVCWRDLAANPWFAIPINAVRPFAAPRPRPEPDAPGPLAFADADRVRAILERAGFERVRFETFDAKLSFGSRASATELLTQIGPAEDILHDAEPGARANAKLALDAAFKEYETDGEVRLDASVWVVTAYPV